MGNEMHEEAFVVPADPARLWGLAAFSLTGAVAAILVVAFNPTEGVVGGAIEGGAAAAAVIGLLNTLGWASKAWAGRPLVVVRPDGIEDNAGPASVGFVPRASLGAPSMRRKGAYRFLVLPAASPGAAAAVYRRLPVFRRLFAGLNRRFGLVVIPGNAVPDLEGLKARIEAMWSE